MSKNECIFFSEMRKKNLQKKESSLLEHQQKEG